MMKALNQIELEQQNMDIVLNKQAIQVEKHFSNKRVGDLKQVSNIVPYYVSELENKLKLYLATVLTGKAHIKPVPAKVLTLVNPAIVAHFTVKAVINLSGHRVDSSNKFVS